MKRRSLLAAAVLVLLPASVRGQDADLTGEVQRIFNASCTQCHAGAGAPEGLVLTEGEMLGAVVNAASTEVPELKLVAPRDPESSYLYQKTRGDESIQGSAMPLAGPPLSDEDLETLRAWIRSFSEAWGEPQASGGREAGLARGDGSGALFFDGRNALLPTTGTMGVGVWEYDILHRFYTPVQDAEFKNLYGLDFGANISFYIGYGITDRLDVGLRRSGDRAHFEGLVRYRFLDGSDGRPVAAGGLLSWGTMTDGPGFNENSLNVQLSVGVRPHRALSLLLVPSYSTRTDPQDENDEEGTLALGVGLEGRFLEDWAVVVEGVPTLSGHQADHPAVTGGLKYRIGGHTFMLLLSNSTEMNTDLYLPGGRLDPSDQLVLGFNITRRIF